MHILVIPSEEFVPEHNHLLGIFQLDQAKILHAAGYKIGVVSVRLEYSLPMLLKALLFRLIGKKRNNKTNQFNFLQLLKLLARKLFMPGSFIEKDDKFNFPVYRIEGFYLLPPNQKRDLYWWERAGMRAVDRYIKENGRPDVMYVHIALNAGLTAMEIKRKYGIPYWLTERISFFARGLYHESLLARAKESYENADTVLTVSNFLGRGMMKIFPDFRYQVFPNTVDPIIENTPLSNEKYPVFTFLTIGNLIPLKKHDLLICAFHRTFSEDTNVQLHIIGNGTEKERLQDLINELKEQSRIKLLGSMHKNKVLEKLDASHVLCHQSEYETFGVAVLEALFRGVPVIATRCGGPEETVMDEDGILIPKNDIHALVSALKEMKDNHQKYSPIKIRQRAIQRFGAEAFLERFNKIVEGMSIKY